MMMIGMMMMMIVMMMIMMMIIVNSVTFQARTSRLCMEVDLDNIY